MSGKDVVRIASGQGFWGDDLEAPVRQVEGGPIDYLMLDYLAEVTMSIMQKQRARDPEAGFARDFVPLMQRIFPACIEGGVRVVTNAGGREPRRMCRGPRRGGTCGWSQWQGNGRASDRRRSYGSTRRVACRRA